MTYLRDQLIRLDKIEKFNEEHSVLLPQALHRLQTLEEEIPLHKRLLGETNAVVRDVALNQDHMRNREKETQSTIERMRDALHYEIKQLRIRCDAGFEETRTRLDLIFHENETIKKDQESLLKDLDSPQPGLSSGLAQKINREVEDKILSIRKELGNYFQEKDLQFNKTKADFIADISELRQMKSLLFFESEKSWNLLKDELRAIHEELSQKLAKQEGLRVHLESTFSQQLTTLEKDVGDLQIKVHRVDLLTANVDHRQQLADSFMSDAVWKIEDLCRKEMQKLENTILQRVGNHSISRMFEARLFSLETRLKLEESDRMLRQHGISSTRTEQISPRQESKTATDIVSVQQDFGTSKHVYSDAEDMFENPSPPPPTPPMPSTAPPTTIRPMSSRGRSASPRAASINHRLTSPPPTAVGAYGSSAMSAVYGGGLIGVGVPIAIPIQHATLGSAVQMRPASARRTTLDTGRRLSGVASPSLQPSVGV
eukprot:TRINITY_DN2318_c0_g1_i2.p1 TRINITY_DN2318_c0_g1~~TRINITY_DN2318_c0_g1_i2.p1  ORF type:complete len:485 (+),score=116.83 TRINITY_DN2318_c0_g1_i2:270-1724(+)